MQKLLVLCVFLLASLVFFNSCRKHAKIYHVTGVLLSGCDLKPMADAKVSISSKSNLITHGTDSETRTDSLGYFDLPYNPSGEGLTLYVNNHFSLGNIPMTENVDLGMYICCPTSEYVIRIDFGSTFTNKDTLILYNSSSFAGTHKIGGPFKDTIFPMDTCYHSGYESRIYNFTLNHFYYEVLGEIWRADTNGTRIKLHNFQQSIKLINCNSYPDTLKLFIP